MVIHNVQKMKQIIFGYFWLMSWHFNLDPVFAKADDTHTHTHTHTVHNKCDHLECWLGAKLQRDWSLYRPQTDTTGSNWLVSVIDCWSRGNPAGQTGQSDCPSVCLNRRNTSVCARLAVAGWLIPACQVLAGLYVRSVITVQECCMLQHIPHNDVVSTSVDFSKTCIACVVLWVTLFVHIAASVCSHVWFLVMRNSEIRGYRSLLSRRM